MPIFDTDRRFYLRSAPTLALAGAALFAGCIADEPGLTDPAGAGAAAAGGSENGAGTAGSSANVTGQGGDMQAAGAPGAAGQPEVAGSASGGTASGGTAGSEPIGGTEATGAGAGQGGALDEGGVHIPPTCTFHTDATSVSEGGAGGAPSAPTVTVQLSAFVGSYLADATGRTLFTYGGDLPGDCNTPPQSLCTADCLVSWPPFDAGLRLLPEGLTDEGFGSIARGDGTFQTTYLGWPLYYYKSDLALGQLTGQGKGKTWHAAEVMLPSVTIMKTGVIKYLADGSGHTLYVSAADQPGTADLDPVSNCTGSCLATFEGFPEKNLSVVTSLEPLDFSVFVRQGAGGIQVAYKGMPLYRAATDLKSGDMSGTAVTGFTAALP